MAVYLAVNDFMVKYHTNNTNISVKLYGSMERGKYGLNISSANDSSLLNAISFQFTGDAEKFEMVIGGRLKEINTALKVATILTKPDGFTVVDITNLKDDIENGSVEIYTMKK